MAVSYDKSRNIITCGGVQISGIKLNAYPRRKPFREPIIEQYKFVPCTDEADVGLQDIAVLSTHIVIENQTGIKVKTVELLDDADAMPIDDLLSPLILQSLLDSVLIQPEVNLITTRDDLVHQTLPANVIVMNTNEVAKSADVSLAVGQRLLSNERMDNWNLLLNTLKPGGFVLTRENNVQNLGDVARSKGVHIVLLKKYGGEWFVLLRKQENLLQDPAIVYIKNEQFDWLDTMRKGMAETLEKNVADNPRILFVAQEGFENGKCVERSFYDTLFIILLNALFLGLLGFMNCIRGEPGSEFVRGILIQDTKAPPFSLENPLYAEQLQKDLAINVLRENGVWGTYRHLPLPALGQKSVQHKYVRQLVQGDLNSFEWLEGPLDPELDRGDLIRVVYGSLNWRWVLIRNLYCLLQIPCYISNSDD